MHGAEEDERPDQREAPDVGGVVEVAGLLAADWEGPVEGGEGGRYIVGGRGIRKTEVEEAGGRVLAAVVGS